MEPSESDSASVPNASSRDPLMGPHSAPSSPTSLHDRDPEPSDLEQTAQEGALCVELQGKLDLKGEGEESGATVDKVLNFNEVVDDEGVNGGDVGVKGDDEGVNGGDEGVNSGDVGATGGDLGADGDEGVKGVEVVANGGDEGVKSDGEGVKDDGEGANGGDVGANGGDEGVKGDDDGVKSGEVGANGGDGGVKGDDEVVKGGEVGGNGGDEGFKGDDVGANGGDEGVNGEDESFKGDYGCGDDGAKGDVGFIGDGDSRGWETNSWEENVNEGVNGGDDWVGDRDVVDDGIEDGDGDGVEKREERSVSGGGMAQQQHPQRAEAPDCAFYMKTGTCKFGFNCKFNHPIGRKSQAVKEWAGEREEPAERSGQTECKYYLRSGGCKFGKDCKYNHTRSKDSTSPTSELNFLGLPIRLGKRECPYYMRTGSCKFGANCKFNHPDPTTVAGSDSPSGLGDGGLHGVSQPSVSSWSSPRALNETSPFVPMMPLPTQAVSPQSSDWNGYQAPVYLPERSMHPPSTYVINNPAIETNVYMHQQKQMQVEEFPERPGEPECSFFLKTGDCKFKSNCKFHHPKNRGARLPPCNLNDKGLPLRPDKSTCSHYSRYGICKFGPACKFDHPNSLPSTIHTLDPQSGVEVAGMGGSRGG